MEALVPVLCVILIVIDIIHSDRKGCTVLYGVLSAGLLFCVIFAVSKTMHLKVGIIGRQTLPILFVIPTCVISAYTRRTSSMKPRSTTDNQGRKWVTSSALSVRVPVRTPKTTGERRLPRAHIEVNISREHRGEA